MSLGLTAEDAHATHARFAIGRLLVGGVIGGSAHDSTRYFMVAFMNDGCFKFVLASAT